MNHRFAIPLPKELPLERAGPLLCAGITTYSPLKRLGAGPGVRVGVNGLGGLGTMAVKQAKAMGATVTVLSRSKRKEAYAKSIGADRLVATSDTAAIKEAGRSLDLVIDTVAQRHDIGINVLAGGIVMGQASSGTLLDLLDVSGTWCFVGAALDMIDLQPCKLLMQQHLITGSKIGGIAAQRECVNFCAEHGVLPETEVLPATPESLVTIYEALDSGNDSGKRFVIDLGALDEDAFHKPAARAPKLRGRSHLITQVLLLVNRMALSRVEDIALNHSNSIAGALFFVVAGFAAAKMSGLV